ARRDEGGLKPLRMEVEQSRKRFLPDISGFQTFLEQSVTQRRRFLEQSVTDVSRTKCNAAPAPVPDPRPVIGPMCSTWAPQNGAISAPFPEWYLRRRDRGQNHATDHLWRAAARHLDMLDGERNLASKQLRRLRIVARCRWMLCSLRLKRDFGRRTC